MAIRTHATILDDIQDDLGSNTTDFTDAILTKKVNEGLDELSRFIPHVVKHTFQLETRTGKATSDTANALVDSTNAHFVSTDAGKVVYNADDKTWAVVTAYVSTSQLTLSKDIFPDGNENYKMFNSGCKANNQFSIEDMEGDYLWIHYLEYPVGIEREVDSIYGDIVSVGIGFVPADSSDEGTDKNVDVHFAKRQFVSQLTDFAGAVNNESGYATGSTSMAIDALQDGTPTIAVGQEFTVAGIRGVYRVTTAVAVTSNAATIIFFPGLESAAVNDDVITFVQSTLRTYQEELLIELVGANAMISIAAKFTKGVNVGSQSIWRRFMEQGQDKRALVLRRLEKEAGKYQRPHEVRPRGYITSPI